MTGQEGDQSRVMSAECTEAWGVKNSSSADRGHDGLRSTLIYYHGSQLRNLFSVGWFSSPALPMVLPVE